MKSKLMLMLVCLFMSAGLLCAQTTTVRGVVTSEENGLPIIGAAVIVKGTPQGGVTNLDGEFTILNVPESAKFLQVSYIGYKTVEVPITKFVKVILKVDTQVIDEVVVTAMGITRKQKSLGYSTQKIGSEKLEMARVTDLGNALAGKVSGTKFKGASGATFDAGSIVLRGTTSLRPGGSEPIYVVDGVITNKNMVNMDDVASVNVLKGPAATSLYGSQGGNGAIIITTKGGAKENMRVEVSHTLMFETGVNHYNFQSEYGGGSGLKTYKFNPKTDNPEWKVLDGGRYYDYNNDESWGAKFDGEPYIPFYAWDPTSPGYLKQVPWKSPSKNNVLELYRTGVTNTTNVAFMRSGKDYMSRVSFSNVQRRGVVPNSDAVRRFLTVKTSFKPMKNLNVELDYKYTYRKNHNAAVEGYGGQSALYTYTQWFNRNVDIRDLKDYKRPDGSFRSWNIRSIYDFTPAFHNNPFAMFHAINKTSSWQWNVFSGKLMYEITPKLKAAFMCNGNIRQFLFEESISKGLIGSSRNKDKYEQRQNRTVDITTQGNLSYSDRFFDGRLTFDAAAFVEARTFKYNQLRGYTTDGLAVDGFFSTASSVGKPLAESYKEEFRTQSLFGTITAGFDDTYFMDLSARNDWDSRLPESNNNYFYSGVSVSALAHKWMPKATWLNFLKLRASAAQVGSTLNPYQTIDVYNIGKYGTLTYMNSQRALRNAEIKPTISTSYEAGIEFRMLNNRLWGDINLYNRDTKDQIIDMDITGSTGYTGRTVNAGKIRNRGIELTLGGRIIDERDWTWEADFNIAKNKNELIELVDGQDKYRLTWMGFSTKIYTYAEVGQPIGVIRGSDWKRDDAGNIVFQKVGNPKAAKIYGEYLPMMDTGAQTELGNIQPDATGGFSTSLRYKNFTLSAAIDFQIGGDIASVTNMFGEFTGLLDKTVGKNDRGGEIRDPLSKNGGVHLVGVDKDGNPVDTYCQAQFYHESRKGNLWSDYIYDASYVKLREISIAYRLPKKLLNRTGFLKDASISVVAQNPWLIYSGVPNIDASEVGNAWGSYIDMGQSFSTRSFGITAKLAF